MRLPRWIGPALILGLFLAVTIGRDLFDFRSLPPPELVATGAGQRLNVSFIDAQGRSRTLEEFSGRLVLVNVWATWCPPCRDEIPALNSLQQALGGPDFMVLPISVDPGGIATAQRYLDRVGAHALAAYAGSEDAVLKSLAVVALPTTILIDERGAELGRMVGPAAWESSQDLVARELNALTERRANRR